jgi:hypothetical protein
MRLAPVEIGTRSDESQRDLPDIQSGPAALAIFLLASPQTDMIPSDRRWPMHGRSKPPLIFWGSRGERPFGNWSDHAHGDWQREPKEKQWKPSNAGRSSYKISSIYDQTSMELAEWS